MSKTKTDNKPSVMTETPAVDSFASLMGDIRKNIESAADHKTFYTCLFHNQHWLRDKAEAYAKGDPLHYMLRTYGILMTDAIRIPILAEGPGASYEALRKATLKYLNTNDKQFLDKMRGMERKAAEAAAEAGIDVAAARADAVVLKNAGLNSHDIHAALVKKYGPGVGRGPSDHDDGTDTPLIAIRVGSLEEAADALRKLASAKAGAFKPTTH